LVAQEGASLMVTGDKPQLPSLSTRDEKKAQKELDRLRKNENRTFKATRKRTNFRTGFGNKTLWDWLQLLAALAVPLILGIATIGFGLLQANLAQQQHQLDQQNMLDQQQAILLQSYIDNIQDALLNHNLLGDSPKPKDDADKVKIQEVRLLARARTLITIQRLDPGRKGRLIQFLHETELINFQDDKGKKKPLIIDISNSDLSHADLSYEVLRRADLQSVDFLDAILRGADFLDAILRGAYFAGVDLRDAQNLSQQQLDSVSSCFGAILPKGLTCHKL
jgi:uncharacterized protein YjbI with pentapeptide repeats